MKFEKRSAMAISFLLGVFMLITSATADIATKTGYEKLKDSLKLTTKNASKTYQNFTIESNMALKQNGELIASENSIQKYDVTNNAILTEQSSLSRYGQKSNTLNYEDKAMSIKYNSEKDIYYVYDRPEEVQDSWSRNPIQDPFEYESVVDVEKIIDALLGNLKDYVVVNQNEKGTKQISANLKEHQIPALINAVASFVVKISQEIDRNDNNNSKNAVTVLTKDIYIGEFKGRADLNQNEEIEGILLTTSLFGKDKDNVTHEFVVEILANIIDINNTVVEKPDLTGKTVEKTMYQTYESYNTDIDRYVGKYKSEIFTVNEKGFEKIGERFIEITKNDDGKVLGKYYELNTDSENKAERFGQFEFEAQFENYSISFNFIDSNGEEYNGNIRFEPSQPILYFDAYPIDGIEDFDRVIMNSAPFQRVFD
jgi:hypothetical protein